jgi:hypothetical protein
MSTTSGTTDPTPTTKPAAAGIAAAAGPKEEEDKEEESEVTTKKATAMASAGTSDVLTVPEVASSASTNDLDYKSWAKRTSSRLEDLYDGITAPFCCGGTMTLSRPVEITTLQDGRTHAIRPPLTLARDPRAPVHADMAQKMTQRQSELLQELVAMAPKAVFGIGTEEVYDESVRHGRQIFANDLATNLDPAALRGVLRTIQRDLGIASAIEAVPYSINLYEEGGLFESHKDTPRGSHMFGTLVLCLPSLFVGGALQVGMTPETVTSHFGVNFGRCRVPLRDNQSGDPSWWQYRGTAKDDASVAVPWCAFFADADHRVRPVRKGVRVTLSYLLRRSDDGAASAAAAGCCWSAPRALTEDEDRTRALTESFREALWNSPFEGTIRIAVPCDHMYTQCEVFPHREVRNPYDINEKGCDHDESVGALLKLTRLTSEAEGRLKGRDAMVARAARRAGLRVSLVPFLNHRDPALATWTWRKSCTWWTGTTLSTLTECSTRPASSWPRNEWPTCGSRTGTTASGSGWGSLRECQERSKPVAFASSPAK